MNCGFRLDDGNMIVGCAVWNRTIYVNEKEPLEGIIINVQW